MPELEPDALPAQLTVDVANMVQTLSRRFHEKPLAGLREAVQNAIDAVRDAESPRIDVELTPTRIAVRDNGTGMSVDEVRARWGRVFDSAKAGDSDAIGEFGIGRLALLGLGDPLILDTHDGDAAVRVTVDAAGRLHWGEGERAERGTTVAVTGDFGQLLEEALPYVRRVAEKRPEPLYVNGERVSGRPYHAPDADVTHMFTGPVRGALGVHDTGTARGVRLYHKGLYVCDLHLEEAVSGEVNCDHLTLVATRDGVQEDQRYDTFRRHLDEEVGKLWSQVARSPHAPRFERHLFRRARHTREEGLIHNIPVELADGTRAPWREVLARAQAEGKAITYYSGERNPVVEDALERGLVIAVRVKSGDARLALHDAATRHGVESIYRDDALRRRLDESEQAKHVEGAGFEALAGATRALLEREVRSLQVLFMESNARQASLAGNVLELNVQDATIQAINAAAKSDQRLAQALLIPVVARELARAELDLDVGQARDELYVRRVRRIEDRLVRRVAEGGFTA